MGKAKKTRIRTGGGESFSIDDYGDFDELPDGRKVEPKLKEPEPRAKKLNQSKAKWQQGDKFMSKCAHKVSPIAQSVWFMLWLKSDKWTGNAKVTHGLLMQFTGKGKTTISDALKSLIEAGFIERVRQGHSIHGESVASIYRILIDPSEGMKEFVDSEPMDKADDLPF